MSATLGARLSFPRRLRKRVPTRIPENVSGGDDDVLRRLMGASSSGFREGRYITRRRVLVHNNVQLEAWAGGKPNPPLRDRQPKRRAEIQLGRLARSPNSESGSAWSRVQLAARLPQNAFCSRCGYTFLSQRSSTGHTRSNQWCVPTARPRHSVNCWNRSRRIRKLYGCSSKQGGVNHASSFPRPRHFGIVASFVSWRFAWDFEARQSPA